LWPAGQDTSSTRARITGAALTRAGRTPGRARRRCR
jgi:hypothetical protein